MASQAEIVSDSFQDSIQGLEQRLIDELLRTVLRGLSVEDGRLVQNESNTKLLIGIKREVIQAFERAGYFTTVEDYLSTFDELSEDVIAIHKEINDIEVSQRLLNPTKASFVQSTSDTLLTDGVNVRFINPIRQGLFSNINQGARVSALERSIRKAISGKLNQWAGQVARDASFQYQGQAHALVKKQFKLNAVRYSGTIVRDSRGQCRKWLKMGTLTDEQINQEVKWALKPNSTYTENGKTYRVSGMIATTTPETFLINRGGWNCRHEAIPVRVDE